MSIYWAVLRHLFARSGHGKGSMVRRAALFATALGFGGFFAYKYAPSGEIHSSLLLVVLALSLVNMVFLLLDIYQRSLLRRLQVVGSMPLTRQQAKALYLLAYIPVSALALGITAPGLYKFFAGDRFSFGWLLSVIAACAYAVVFTALLRCTNRCAQPISLLCVAVGVSVGWSTITSGMLAFQLERWLALAFITQIILIIQACIAPVRSPPLGQRRTLREYRTLTLGRALMLRGVRSGRYMAANAFIVLVMVGLCLVSGHDQYLLPFDAVAVMVVLLSGTLAQEARSLSKQRYPVELVDFGLLGRWLLATWQLLIVNVTLFVVGTMLLASTVFPGGLSVSNDYVVCAALCLAGVGALSASLIAPAKGDLLAQLAATGLYAGLAWAGFKLLAAANTNATLYAYTLLVVGVSACIAFGLEKRRWLLTIKGRYG